MKPKIKCSDCDNRLLKRFDEEAALEHLLGKQIFGIYPLLKDETCNFLAIDFDKSNWMEDVKAFVETCKEKDIPIGIERSRSGNGAHVWIFFSQPIKASTARKLGSFLLTCTMERRYEVGLDSYDRLFPNQDTMSKGGFGNLIALPLQKVPRENGNSVFVHESFMPYEDQWCFLSNLKKMDLEEVENLIKAYEENQNENEQLSLNNDKIQVTKKVGKSSEDIKVPEIVEIVLKNMIFIKKEGLPSKIITKLIRTATFSNPEFYKAQAMRLSTYNKPRIINCSEVTSENIILPRGSLDLVKEIFSEYKNNIKLVDQRFSGNLIEAQFNGQLTEVQIKAAEKLLSYDNGVLCAATGFGKTVLATWLIGERKVNNLIIVHRKQLMDQWKERLTSFLNIDKKLIGVIGGGKNKKTGIIDIGIVQSLYNNKEVKELVKEYGQVIVDECHHISAFSFEQILKKVGAKYVCGLTATLVRKDGHHPIITMQCGKIRHKVNYKDMKKSPVLLTERRSHIDYFEERFKGFVKNIVVLKGGMGKKQREAVREQLNNITENEERLIIASGKYIGEGFDDSRLDTLFLVMPISWKGTLQQYAGRLHRNHHNKKVVKIYDYVDEEIPMLKRMFDKRIKGYKNMGYDIRSGEENE